MKKRIISLLLATAMLLSVTSCSKKEQTLDVENMTLEEYIEAVELPKNLTISIDPATVEERETAKIYTNLEYVDFDIDMLAEKLLQNPVTEKSVWALGPQYRALTDTQQESLVAFDGGEAYSGADGQGSDGGFYYFRKPASDEPTVLDTTYAAYPWLYRNDAEMIIAQFGEVFQSVDKELDFSSREEIAEKADTFLKDVGVPNFEVHEIMAYDTEALRATIEHGATFVDSPVKPEPQKSDEHYWVLCRQLVDGIPINSYGMRTTDAANWAESSISFQYTQEGLINVRADNLIQQPTGGTEENLISAAEALELAKDSYGQGVLLKPYTIEAMELVYILYFQNQEGLSLTEMRPYWLIKTSYQQDYPVEKEYSDWEGNPLEGEVKAYDYTYFDAVTGEYFNGSTSGKPIE